jgi:hypothetical protein
MDDPNAILSRLLSDVILPNLKAVQASQAEQSAANDRLEQAIEELRLHLKSQLASISAQLTACRAELAATQAMLKAKQVHGGSRITNPRTLLH